jgi:hypothetical protein
MKGRGRIKNPFWSIVPDSPVGVLHEDARQRDVGVNVGRARRRLGVDAGGERRILFEDAYVVLRVPISARVLSRPRGQPAIHSSISAHDGVRPRPDGLNQKRRPHQSRWATAFVERASVRDRDSGGALEASDLPTAQCVEDEGQELAGDGDPSLVLAGVLGDACVVGAELLVALGPAVADSLDGRPAHEG